MCIRDRPDGGFIGLVRQDAPRRTADEADDEPNDDDDDREKESLLDFYFYGPQSSDKSYGRRRTGFGFQTPTPNQANSTAGN